MNKPVEVYILSVWKYSSQFSEATLDPPRVNGVLRGSNSNLEVYLHFSLFETPDNTQGEREVLRNQEDFYKFLPRSLENAIVESHVKIKLRVKF